MPTNTAAELEDLFQDAFAARDAAGIAALCEDHAVLVAPGGHELRGSRAIAGLAEEFWKDDLAYVSEVTRVTEAGEVALVVFRWSTSRPDGTVADQGTGVDIIRRQPDGTWKYLIGLPSGTA